MRLLSSLSLLMFGSLLCGVSSQQFPTERESELGDPSKTIVDNLLVSRTILAAHHLQLPMLSPLRRLFDDKTKTSTLFAPDNKALTEALHRIDEVWCENGESVRIQKGKFKRSVKKEIIKEVLGKKEFNKLSVTDSDCDNLARLIELDQKVLRDVSRLRGSYREPREHSQQLKMLLRQNEDEYRRIRFNPDFEKYVLARCSHGVVPGRVDVREMQLRDPKILPTLLSRPDVLPIKGWESNTKLVLKKASDGQLNIVFSSPAAPHWRVEVDDRPIESVNGLIYITRSTVPYPHSLSSMLLWNKLFFTHALFNYTGLLDQLDQRKDITVLAPTDRVWMTVLPRMLDKPTIRRMTRDVKQRFRLLTQLPFIRRVMEEEEKEYKPTRIEQLTADERKLQQPTYIRLREVEPEETVAEGQFDSSQTDVAYRLGKSEIRDLLMSHIIEGSHFSTDLARFDTLTAMSGANLPITTDRRVGQTVIGKSRILFDDIPINNGVMHIVDDIVTEPTETRFRE